jgi:hypothetical protein
VQENVKESKKPNLGERNRKCAETGILPGFSFNKTTGSRPTTYVTVERLEIRQAQKQDGLGFSVISKIIVLHAV